MRLKAVKLAGFKSFVDPTSISFPFDVTAIVGPNGCGKSNIIDAVRWVLGEGSAKNLRSQSMSDVVFKGSASRKPVSRASVELVFDNSEGRIGGEFTDYSEISVRRELELDRQSNYYLNGTSCRKRDITDLFLGTGLGPKSYAIIEQDMISRLVSSKPEEMREYLEEVAGISRYLERRKETESRIKRTRENLNRLEDLREEIGRLLFKLKQQARAAERYTELRKEEKNMKGLLWAYEWQSMADKTANKAEKVRLHQIKTEEINSLKTSSDSERDTLRTKQMEMQSEMDSIQQKFYSVGADISRSEQEIKANKEKESAFIKDLNEKEDALRLKKISLEELINSKKKLEKTIDVISPELEKLREKQLKEDGSNSKLGQVQIEWSDYSLKLNELLENLKKAEQQLLVNVKEGKTSEKAILFDSGLKQVEETLNALSQVSKQLIEKTNKLFLGSNEEDRAERLELLDKTGKFADLQARLATNISQEHHLESEIASLEAQISDLKAQISSNKGPLKMLKESLEELLTLRLLVEEKMTFKRKSIDHSSDKIRNIETERLEKEQKSMSIMEELEALRLEHQASQIETQNKEKQIEENDLELKNLLTELDENKSSEDYVTELEKVERRISRLGAINMAAKEEYKQEEERKLHLDKQHNELISALETLQNAINRIDKETRTTFKDTFDKLNQNLAKTFPKLFGGGHAELILLGDNLLTAGVGITARPPGKRNSSVAQLSGGEKALTAIALVFAFFELNSAPFCVLDEVDAPLDDLNTMRFISFVEEMSDHVQFIIISHNKISMERSKHLVGVTMQEPGISRMVGINVDEAIKLAASA